MKLLPKLCVCFACFAGLLPAAAAERVALVIGCNQYTNLPDSKQLTSPVSDATDVAATLKALGYSLVTGAAVTNAGKEAIITATENFAAAAKNADAAVFYFSGHGIQVGEDNFLMPSDAPRLTSYTVLKNRSVHLRDNIMIALEEAKAKTKVIILDCCRENPFAAQVDVALAQVSKTMRTKGGLGEITGYGPGFFLAFATSPGTLADDGNGQRNSPFTAALLTHLKTSAGEDITPLFRKVKATVRQSSGEEQVPWTNDSLDQSFALAPGVRTLTPVMPHAPPGLTEADVQKRVAEELAKQRAMVPAIQSPSPSTSSTSGAPKAGATMTVSLPGGENMSFCYCPAGSFTMGSPASEKDRSENEAQVQVHLTQGFWMAQTECTQGQWEAVMGGNPSYFRGSKDLPVEQVSWVDAQAFITQLNQGANAPAGMKFALPSEAQWEYACRAGTESVFAFGDTLTSAQANFDGNFPYGSTKKGVRLEKTSKVGSYASNAWGLYDMHGNVWEWCADWYAEKRFGGADPVGASVGSYRVYRGGSWGYYGLMCRSATRDWNVPGFRYNRVLGFRLAAVPAGR